MTEKTPQVIYQETRDRMQKAIEALKREFQAVRTGRASAAILDPVRVEYYNSQMSINQLATVSTPDARTLEIRPWDLNTLQEIERALLKANLGITPMNDGKIIRMAFPPLTEERRRELVKQVHKMAEDLRVEVRTHRRKGMETVKNLKKDKVIGEDDEKAAEIKMQKLTDEFSSQIDELVRKKEKELMEV